MPTKPPVHDPLPAHLRAKVNQQREADKERRRKEYEAQGQRADDRRFYSSTRWVKFREWFFVHSEYAEANAMCVECRKAGRVKPATQLDHIKPRKQYPELAYEPSNMQGLCGRCHNSKTRGGQ